MKHSRLVVLPAMTLGFWACADQPDRAPMAPSAALASVVTPPPGWAVVYSNFGPSATFDADPNHGWTINGFLGPDIGQQAIAQQFTPSGDATLVYVQVPLALAAGSGEVRVLLQENANGLPGAVIDEMRSGDLQYTPQVYTATSTLLPTLHRGTSYWLTLAAGADGLVAGWQWNTLGDVAGATFVGTQGGGSAGPWAVNPYPSTRGAFSINSTPLTPQDGLRLLADRMDFLVARGLLPEDQAAGLSDKVAAAIASIERGSDGAACNQLYAFIRQTLTLLKTEATPNPIGQELIGSAGTVRGELGCA